MTTTSQVREWWAPACKAHVGSLTEAYKALDTVLKKHGYRPRSGVTGAFNCRPITGGTNFSLHAYDPDGFFTFWTGVRVTKAIAVDINWDENPYGRELVTDMPKAMIAEIKSIKTKGGLQVWRWGGDYSGNKDAMHFEIIVSPAQLAKGVVQPGAVAPKPAPQPVQEQPMIFHIEGSTYTFFLRGTHLLPLYEDEFWTLAGAGVPVKSIPNDQFVRLNKQLQELSTRQPHPA